ncbi:hypothetical protein [uncultured Agathobaculum sp.]|uniref:hypothetical protein n=1 Tax=uncultured Agathobaculum sp. TaxID=2048140 RepID=UPI002607D373|nr:hypothetical protein [uncultured Agathobaculum sp.]
MQTVQRVLLLAFAVLAALTVFQQMRYGMICGRAEGEDKQADPKAKACRQRAVLCAVGAAACLVVNIAIGALSR